MKYEIGQQVETPFGKGKIFDTNNSGDMYHVTLKNDGSTRWFWENYLKPYRTPHEKLLDMGFELEEGTPFKSIKVYTTLKKFHITRIHIYTEQAAYSVLNDDLVTTKLSRILTEYLEWLEEEK